MVLAAALISLAVAAQSAAVQAPAPGGSQSETADDSKPYSIAGVRRAASDDRPASIEYNASTGGRQGYHVTIDSRAVRLDQCSELLTACQPAWRGGANPTWHDQFITMAGPQGYDVPFTGMTNGQRLQAVASSVAIDFVLQEVFSLVQNQVVRYKADRKQKQIEKIRAEIRAELDALERANAAARGPVPAPVR